MIRPLLAVVHTFAVLGATAAAPAQPVPPTPAAAPVARPAAHDPEVAGVLGLLRGYFVAPPSAAGESSAAPLTWRCAPVRIDGLPGTVYFEVVRADTPADPYRQGIIQVFRRQGELRLRVFDLTGEVGLPGSLVGLWAAPEAFPPLPLDVLSPNLDLVLTRRGQEWHGRTPHPFPSIDRGAVEMNSELLLAPGSFRIADRGYDASGAQVWGPPEGEMLAFAAAPSPVHVTRHSTGLTIIDLVPPAPDAPTLAPGGNIAVHYAGWRTDGHQFENSRTSGRPPLRTRVPGTGVKGVDEGLLGMAAGTRRRLVIPASLAFGDQGSVRGGIPPGATLVYDLEALEVQNAVPGSPAAPPVPPAPPVSPTPPSSRPQLED